MFCFMKHLIRSVIAVDHSYNNMCNLLKEFHEFISAFHSAVSLCNGHTREIYDSA